ncbi:MAG: mannose-1-phosphate guanylyltransferase, partial [Burkholderiales bacterium]|nr:mannose-1-phosphate guanylyltransferase [Anaerolineae bacterium]
VAASSFVSSGEYSWNSGMFIWKAEQAMTEYQRQQPDIYTLLEELAPFIDTPQFDTQLASVWERMPKISLDYAVMEGAENVAVIPVDVGWSDIGTWGALFEVVPLDSFGNGRKGQAPLVIMLETANTLVYSDKLAVTIGVRDLVIVETEDALLICHKDHTQEVKEVVNYLKATRQQKYL